MQRGNISRLGTHPFTMSLIATLVPLLTGTVQAQAPPPLVAPPPQAAAAELEEVVVSGFRAALGAALDVKRAAVASVDAIVAEDIAKFPDQNLAESLQRIPGISIQRDGGEGRSITVRGLGSQFTRVRVNGMETVATATDGASSNRDRAFDFNVFASELFSSIVVHKTAEASVDEGSLGAVVDLNTGNPLAGRTGATFAASAQGSNNSLSKDWGPRLAGLLSWKAPSGTWGAALSAAFSKADTLELGNNSVRWAQSRFDSVGGTRCYTTQNAGGTYIPSSACDSVALAFHPRIPRYGVIAHDRERLGLTGSLQWAPTERTKASLDALYSRFRETRGEQWAEVLFRTLERPVDVLSYSIDGNNNLIRGSFNDVPVRIEAYQRDSTTRFQQLGLTLDHEFTDAFRIHLLAGASSSDADIPKESTIIFDDRDAQGYSYDYSNSRGPVLTFGTSVSTPANFQLSEIRDRPSNVTNKFRTASLKAEWDANEQLTLRAGAVYRRFSFDSVAYTRDTVVCGNGGLDRVLGTLTCSPTALFGPTAIYGFPVTAMLSQPATLGSAGQPAGTTSNWIGPNIAAAAQFTGLYNRTPLLDTGNNRGVVERVTGGFLELDHKGSVFGLDYRANAGARYVKTDQSARGINNSLVVTVDRDYSDWLPALNLAFYPTADLIVRAAASKVLTRPTLGQLTPGGTVDGFNYRVSFGNPFLDPYRAKAYDLSLEWYFAPQAIASVAVFKKDVSSFPVASTRSGTFASTGLPLSVILPSSPAAANPEGQPWTITGFGNGAGANLKGIELSIQSPFTFLPGKLANFGGIANATFVDSDALYTVSGPAIVSGGALITTTRLATLFGLSRQAYNGTLYYEDDRFGARLSGSYRSKFFDATSGTGNVFEGYNSSLNLDASLKYKLNDNIEVSLEGINLTDDYRDRFTDEDADRVYENNHFGRTIMLGVRYKN